jgi:hypothetical protein
MRVPPTNNNDERYSLTSRAALTTLPGTSSERAEEVGNASKSERQTPHLLRERPAASGEFAGIANG